MAKTLIKAATPTGAPAVISFIDGASDVVFDNTYPVYEFHFMNIHPVDDNVDFSFQVNSTNDAGGGYDTSLITSTHFAAYHHETSGVAALADDAETDLAQEANEQVLGRYFGNEDDESGSGELTLYDPSSTDYIKHFQTEVQHVSAGDTCNISRTAGYINTESAVDGIKFFFSYLL